MYRAATQNGWLSEGAFHQALTTSNALACTASYLYRRMRSPTAKKSTCLTGSLMNTEGLTEVAVEIDALEKAPVVEPTIEIVPAPEPLHPVAPAIIIPNLDDSSLYIHRELSQLQFNIRVLEQALDESYPLLERLKFLLIFSSNLDEFFEIRVAGLKKQITFAREQAGADGLQPHQALARISELVHGHVDRQYAILNDILLPELEKHQVRFIRRRNWNAKIKAWVRRYFRDEIAPIITPIGLDPTHPFPHRRLRSRFRPGDHPGAAPAAAHHQGAGRRRRPRRQLCVPVVDDPRPRG
jgi:hypothetical protein